MSDVIENFKVSLNASKIVGKIDGIVLSMKVIEKVSREYSENTSLDKAQGATQSAMYIARVLKDLADELKKEMELTLGKDKT